MRLSRIMVGMAMTARELLRSRLVLMLLLVIPSLFYTIVGLTGTDRLIAFKLAAIPAKPVIEVSERSESLVFIGTAVSGLLASYLALGLMQKQSEVNRRLVLCGYRPSELIGSKLAILLIVIVSVGIYVGGMLPIFFRPERIVPAILGFVLAGFVYACYGLLVGALLRRELEGVLFIVLLANIDAGWLQNPVYYAGAQNQFIIRALPAYYPSQLGMIGAFTAYGVIRPVIAGMGYGLTLLLAALAAYFVRMRVRR
ncbi:MAG TPA: hypothetical protein VE398_10130 [Acidobacteriota bacterium]|nr:hypothetical protein [Acidobacteriota bacterium]